MASEMTVLADNCTYTLGRSKESPAAMDVLDVHGQLAARFDHSTGKLSTLDGAWGVRITHHPTEWQLALVPQGGGPEAAHGGPALGLEDYSAHLSSGEKFRIGFSQLQRHWKVHHDHETIMTLAAGTHERAFEIKSTGLSSHDLSVVVCMVLLFEFTERQDAGLGAFGSGATI